MCEFPRLDSADIISVDCETRDDSLQDKGIGATRDGYIVGVALATRDAEWYFPVAHEGGGNLDKQSVYRWLNDVLGTSTPKVGANLAYDVTYLWSEGVQIQGPFWDVQVAEPLLDENKFSYSLETIAQERLGIGKDEDTMCEYIRQHFGAKAGKEKSFIWKCPAHIVAPYAKQDVALPIQIFDQQIKELREQELEDLFTMESDLLPILVRMHLNGVRVDAGYAEQLSVEWTKHLAKLESQFMGINPGSGKQIAAYLDSLGVEYPRHKPTKAMLDKGITLGNPKLDAKVLASLEDQVPLLKIIAESKKYSHFLGTFINGYIIDSQVNGRVHGTFNQLKGDEYGTVTGRLSASKPNLQNIPNPEKDPYFSAKCRGMFLPEHGQEWLRYDFSQIEYRLLVHFASTLEGGVADLALAMYRDNPETDFHQMCADLTGVSRKQAKCIAEDSLVLTDKGLVKIQNITLTHRVWDGVEWVAHGGLVCNGVKEVITYDGVTATRDHIVFTEDGREVSIGELAQSLGRTRIFTSAVETTPLRYTRPQGNKGELERQPVSELHTGKLSFQRVFDIQNAGPRNRFTVDGKLVHNCVNFGLVYGMGVDKLAADLGLTRAAANEIFKVYHAKAPFAKAFSEAASQRASKRGYITTIGKRRRRFDMWESTKWLPKDKHIDGEVYVVKDKQEAIDRWGAVRRAGTHKAGNAVLQGSSADITKRAMVEGYKRGVYDILGFPLVTVHDEICFSADMHSIVHQQAAKEMEEIMKNTYPLSVPVLVGKGLGKSWGEASIAKDFSWDSIPTGT